jgi:hypothetical protein
MMPTLYDRSWPGAGPATSVDCALNSRLIEHGREWPGDVPLRLSAAK